MDKPQVDEELAIEGKDPVSAPLEKVPSRVNPLDNWERPTGLIFYLIYIGLALSVLLASLDQTIVSTALPSIASQFNSAYDIGWVGVAYMLTNTCFQPLYGKFADIFGRKPVFLVAICIFLTGSIVSGAAQSMIMLIVFRAVQGIGAGGLVSSVMIIVSDLVSLRDRGKYQGIIGASFGISSVIGPLIGGAFTQYASWRWCFYVNIPIGAGTLFIITVFLKMPRPKEPIRQKLKRIDYVGSFFLMSSTIFILLPLQSGGNSYAWNSPFVISLFCVGGVLLICLILVESKYAKEPLLPGKLLRRRTPLAICIVQFFFGMNFFGGAIYYTPIYFQVARGDSPTSSGLEMLPMILGLVFTSISSGLIASYTGHVRPLVWCGLAIQCIGGGLLSLLQIDSNRGQLIGYLLVMGIGCGLCMQTVLLVAQSSVEPRDIAVITAISNFFRTVGGVFGIAIFGTIYQNDLINQLNSMTLPMPALVVAQNFEIVKTLPEPLQRQVQLAYVTSLDKMRLVIIPFAGVALIASLFIEHFELRKRAGGQKDIPPATAATSDGEADKKELDTDTTPGGEAEKKELATDTTPDVDTKKNDGVAGTTPDVNTEKKDGIADTTIEVAQTAGEDGSGTAIPQSTPSEKKGSIHESL